MATNTNTHSAEAALCILTGILLGPFEDVHRLLDWYYPGIMQMGCAFVGENGSAKSRLLEDHPQLADVALPHALKTCGLTGQPYLDAATPWIDSFKAEHGAEFVLTAAAKT